MVAEFYLPHGRTPDGAPERPAREMPCGVDLANFVQLFVPSESFITVSERIDTSYEEDPLAWLLLSTNRGKGRGFQELSLVFRKILPAASWLFRRSSQ
jgi:hypothetical protein